MKRERALEMSDALTALGQSHTINVSVHDNHLPRERYSVNVTPVLSFSPTDITALQRLADNLGSSIAYIQGSFVFTDSQSLGNG